MNLPILPPPLPVGLGYRKTRYQYSNKDIYEGEWIDGLFQGQGTLSYGAGEGGISIHDIVIWG